MWKQVSSCVHEVTVAVPGISVASWFNLNNSKNNGGVIFWMTLALCLSVLHYNFISVTQFFNVTLPPTLHCFSTDTNEDGWCISTRQDEAWIIPDTDAAILDWADASCTQVRPPLQSAVGLYPPKLATLKTNHAANAWKHRDGVSALDWLNVQLKFILSS